MSLVSICESQFDFRATAKKHESWESSWIQYNCKRVWHKCWHLVRDLKEKNKQGKIHEKYMTCETPRCEARWQNQQWNHEVRSLTPSREIQPKSYTYKFGMVESCKMIHRPREATLRSFEDTTTHWTGCESRGYCVSNWPLLSFLQIYCIEDSSRQ